MRLFSERRVGEDEHSAHDGDERIVFAAAGVGRRARKRLLVRSFALALAQPLSYMTVNDIS